MNILPAGLIKAVYYALAHSLWQGVLLAIVAALIISFTRNAAPAKRYNLLLAAFSIFTFAGIYTFLYQLNHIAHYKVSISVVQGDSFSFPGIVHQYMKRLGSLSYITQAISFLNSNAGLLVLTWLLVIGLRMIQLSLGIKGMQQLRRQTAITIDPRWVQYVQQTAVVMGIKRSVKLAASGLTNVPLTLGYLKPLILVPAGLLLQLPAPGLEAILAHELAHIRRRDYLVNLLQHMVETVYFFNPAVWWVSSLIRAEREHCCDDAAIAVTGDKKHYLDALVSCQEYVLAAPAYVMAFAGTQQQLSGRVKRLIFGQAQRAGRIEKAILSISLLTTLILTLAIYSYNYTAELPGTLSKVEPVLATPQVPFIPIPSSGPAPGGPAAVARDEEAVCMPEPVPAPDTPEAPVVAAVQNDKDDPVITLIGEMEQDGLVAINAPDLHIQLSNNQLEVNGIAQADEVSRKYRDRYIALSGTNGTWTVNYDRETNP